MKSLVHASIVETEEDVTARIQAVAEHIQINPKYHYFFT